jgi:hypothetical protein
MKWFRVLLFAVYTCADYLAGCDGIAYLFGGEEGPWNLVGRIEKLVGSPLAGEE